MVSERGFTKSVDGSAKMANQHHTTDRRRSSARSLLDRQPNFMLKILGKTEKYCKSWMYQIKSDSERVTHWMGRAQKHQFPCAITVDTPPEGTKGYHFMKTFNFIQWSPLMLSVEVIPNENGRARVGVLCVGCDELLLLPSQSGLHNV